MLDVLRNLVSVQRLEHEPPRHPLLQLTQVRTGQHRLQVRLTDEHDLKQRASRVVDVREETNLLEHIRLQMLGLVDDDDGVRFDWGERAEKRVQRLHQLVTADLVAPGPILRDHAEVLEQLPEKVVTIEQRVVDDREKCLALKARAGPFGRAASCRCRSRQ